MKSNGNARALAYRLGLPALGETVEVVALTQALVAERAEGAREMRLRAAKACRDRGTSHAMERRAHEAHTCITLAEEIEKMAVECVLCGGRGVVCAGESCGGCPCGAHCR